MSTKAGKIDLHEFQEALVRSASMQLWHEDIDIRNLMPPILRAIRLLELWPARIEVSHEQSKKLQVRKWKCEDDATFDEFKSIEYLSALTLLPHRQENKRVILRTFAINRSAGLIYIEASPDFLTVQLAIDILSGFLASVTPLFGFGEVTKRVWSFQYHWGIQGSGMDRDRTARAQVLEQVRFTMPGDEPILGRRLFDVHELNFLTTCHLELVVFGMTLEKWIAAGSRGTLKKLKSDVFVWLVPDPVRPGIRSQFLNAGYLLAPA